MKSLRKFEKEKPCGIIFWWEQHCCEVQSRDVYRDVGRSGWSDHSQDEREITTNATPLKVLSINAHKTASCGFPNLHLHSWHIPTLLLFISYQLLLSHGALISVFWILCFIKCNMQMYVLNRTSDYIICTYYMTDYIICIILHAQSLWSQSLLIKWDFHSCTLWQL